MSEMMFELDHLSIARVGTGALLQDVCWQVHRGDAWGIIGPVAAGKTTLAEALIGKHRLVAGSIRWPWIEERRKSGEVITGPGQLISFVGTREDSPRFSYKNHYYQQRFNFMEAYQDQTLEEFLRSELPIDGELPVEMLERLELLPLLKQSLIQLSNGQMRRVRIVRGLLRLPDVLILDLPFMGLDRNGRAEVQTMLKQLHQQGLTLIIIARPEELPVWLTGRLELPGKHLEPRLASDFHPVQTIDIDYGVPIVEFDNVTVRYGNRLILDSINWTVRQGERWAVLGPNGSGKSTLLSLIAADHPQGYSNPVKLFGQPRGSGESIWEIKARIGLVSPEFHFYFTEPLNVTQTIATGFFDGVSYRKINSMQAEIVKQVMSEFGLEAKAGILFARLSTGEQRLVLLARAWVKRPELLILDEPFQTLDTATIERLLGWLDSALSPQQTLLLIVHDAAEIPASVTQRLRLAAGRRVE